VGRAVTTGAQNMGILEVGRDDGAMHPGDTTGGLFITAHWLIALDIGVLRHQSICVLAHSKYLLHRCITLMSLFNKVCKPCVIDKAWSYVIKPAINYINERDMSPFLCFKY
jgi:hypothetical protein